MRSEELAFVNEQLAGLLKSGIPLEDSLKTVCMQLSKGKFKSELQNLEEDLSKGNSLEDSLKQRKFPDFYKKMLIVGGKMDSLPQTLISLADHYRKRSELFLKLSGILIYPALILIVSVAVSIFVYFYLTPFVKQYGSNQELFYYGYRRNAFLSTSTKVFLSQWLTLIVSSTLLVTFVIASGIRPIRYYLSWKWSPFLDANVLNLSSILKMCLAAGMTLADAFAYVANLETGFVRKDLQGIHDRLSMGKCLSESLKPSSVLPDLFKWLLVSNSENPEGGLVMAIDIYRNKANYRSDLLLNVTLPTSIIFLGVLVFFQVWVCMKTLLNIFAICEGLGG